MGKVVRELGGRGATISSEPEGASSPSTRAEQICYIRTLYCLTMWILMRPGPVSASACLLGSASQQASGLAAWLQSMLLRGPIRRMYVPAVISGSGPDKRAEAAPHSSPVQEPTRDS